MGGDSPVFSIVQYLIMRSGRTLASSLQKTHAYILNKLAISGGGTLSYEKADRCIGKVTITNPRQSNAISGLMMNQLAQIIDTVEQEKELKVLLLQASKTSSAFCSGMDFDLFETLNQESKIQLPFICSVILLVIQRKIQG